jgi:hypothetical protein
MAAKSLVLHIGDPKTGTSSIQHVLRNSLWEASTISLAYPDQLNSFPLANALSDPKQAAQRDARFTKLATWLASTDADVAVVSAEQFFRVDPQKLLDTLNEFVPDYVPTLRVVAYVRPHASRFLSAFMQRGKAGLYFGDADTFFKRTKAEKLLRFAPRFQRWRDTFGDRFTLRPMIRNHLRDGDVVSDFLNITLGGAPFKLAESVDANPSLPLEYLVGLRELQAVLKRNQIANGVRHAVGDYVGMTLARTHPHQGTKLQITQELYNKVKLYCQSDAEALDAVFFDGQPLMAQALKQAAADVVAEEQPTVITSHYSEDSIIALREESRNLVSLFKKRPMAWTMAFEQRIGQRISKPGAEPPKQVLAHIEKVNDALTKIARMIAEESLAKPE